MYSVTALATFWPQDALSKGRHCCSWQLNPFRIFTKSCKPHGIMPESVVVQKVLASTAVKTYAIAAGPPTSKQGYEKASVPPVPHIACADHSSLRGQGVSLQ